MKTSSPVLGSILIVGGLLIAAWAIKMGFIDQSVNVANGPAATGNRAMGWGVILALFGVGLVTIGIFVWRAAVAPAKSLRPSERERERRLGRQDS